MSSRVIVAVGALLLSSAAAAAPPPEAGAASDEDVTAVMVEAARPVRPRVRLDYDERSPPFSALIGQRGGSATLECQVGAQGLADACKIVSETPTGSGYGRAALALRSKIRVHPAQGPDGPIASTMQIDVEFADPRPDDRGRKTTTDASSPARLLDPVWAEAPSFDDVARAYPSAAGETPGLVIAQCDVQPTGRLDHCEILSETPDDKGFAAAALGITSKFRVATDRLSKDSGRRLWVNVPVKFEPPARLDRLVRSPSILTSVDPATTPSLFPAAAAAQGYKTGQGAARCDVAADGALTNCTPEAGDPSGVGFSESVAHLASVMKVNLWSEDGSAVAGGVVRIKFRLVLQPPA